MIYFFVFIISFLVVYLTIPDIRYIALRFSIIDKTNGRKIHKKIVTKWGGLGIYFGFLAGLVIAAVFDYSFLTTQRYQILGLIICATLMLLLGIYDHFHGSSAFIKFITQIIISLLLIQVGFKIEKVVVPNLINIELGIFSIPITILWLVGITNALNFIDGLDGLASGIVCIVSFFTCIFGLLLKMPFVIFVSIALMGANSAFLRYNFYPAKIFMGDSGSLFLGFTLGSLAIYRTNPENLNNILFFPFVFLLLLPISDVALAIIRRSLRRQYIFSGDFSHIHHFYIKKGYTQAQTAIRFYIMTFCLGSGLLIAFFLHKILKNITISWIH